jgi:hypothetical protein
VSDDQTKPELPAADEAENDVEAHRDKKMDDIAMDDIAMDDIAKDRGFDDIA